MIAHPPSLAARALRGSLAATFVFVFLFVIVFLLRGGWLMEFLVPACAPLLTVALLPTSFVLALPLAALLRRRPHRGLGALVGAIWSLILGTAIAALIGVQPPELLLIAAILVPSGAALGLGVAWQKP
jgi:hypothetical protein